jgi:hypothetical protein
MSAWGSSNFDWSLEVSQTSTLTGAGVGETSSSAVGMEVEIGLLTQLDRNRVERMIFAIRLGLYLLEDLSMS